MQRKKILMTVILMTLTIFPNCQNLKSIPDELIGTWTTEAQEYRGVYFKLNQTSILFGKKDGSVDSFKVIKIAKARMKADWVKYTIFYRDNELKRFELPIIYNPYKDGIVRFMNKEQNTWIRKNS